MFLKVRYTQPDRNKFNKANRMKMKKLSKAAYTLKRN